MSVCFILPDLLPGRGGVSDYCLKLAHLLSERGYRAEIGTQRLLDQPLVETTERGGIRVTPFPNISSNPGDIAFIQYTQEAWRREALPTSLLPGNRKGKLVVMIHEFWRFSTEDYHLPIRQIPGALRERIQFMRFIRKARPDMLACTNGYYRDRLARAGFNAILSPMPAPLEIIPESHDEIPITPLPAWTAETPNLFLIVSFGALYTNHWSPVLMLQELASLQQENECQFGFLLCGRQTEEDRNRFTLAARQLGFGQFIHFTGPLPARQVPAYLERADAAFAGTSYDFWEKSSSILNFVIRGIPVYLPWSGSRVEEPADNQLVTTSLKRLLTLAKNPTIGGQSPHSDQNAASSFIETFLRAKSTR